MCKHFDCDWFFLRYNFTPSLLHQTTRTLINKLKFNFQRNIVHRDLKLGNIVLNQRTGRVILTNFCLGTHLGSDRDLLKDQRGSPAYISPDVLLCKPYLGKPSDMWALGVVLYTMLYGQFPFCDTSLAQLFNRIQTANYNIPPDGNPVNVSDNTVFLIQRLLVKDPKHRLVADQVLDQLSSIIASYVVVPNPPEDLQVVPDVPLEEDSKPEPVTNTEKKPLFPVGDGERTPNPSDELGVYCVPLPDFLALNFPSPTRVQQSSIIVHPTNTEATQTQKQISIQRIGRDARPLLACEIARYQHMFTNRQETRRSETQNFVPESRENRTRTRNTRSIPSTSSEFRAIPWSERRLQVDQDYVLRFPDIRNSRIMNPAPVHSVNPEAVVNNPRPPTDSSDVEY
ncbi:uncharacterized protein LOC126971759 isoform X2 [Leptidea sinapis]|uniref:uncharacterized protein LOC126971759 isoform X2 n=1 Tax=Leptidea sinapis TaxID=189913 RepID=UPI0021C2FCD8|nr:uncharacterized protein LOC126971759 isoform X2 [Leptidea sinapis]